MITRASIDPGIRGCGIVIWDDDLWGESYPITSYVLDPNIYKSDWVYICADMHKELSKIFNTFNVKKVYCEFPQYFGSDIGHAATSDGKIYKLSCFVGMVMGTIFEIGGTFNPVYVTDWKGQMTKEAVIKRIKRKMPQWETYVPNMKSHAWDAFGIGLHIQGRF